MNANERSGISVRGCGRGYSVDCLTVLWMTDEMRPMSIRRSVCLLISDVCLRCVECLGDCLKESADWYLLVRFSRREWRLGLLISLNHLLTLVFVQRHLSSSLITRNVISD